MKMIQKVLLLGTALIILTGCFNIPIGDGNKLKLSKDGVTLTDGEGGTHSITLDEDEGQVHFEGFGMDEDDEGMSFGQNLSVPDALPGDIPITDDASVYQSSSIQGNVSVVYATNVSNDDVMSLYENYFNSSNVFTSEPNIMEFAGEGLLNKTFSAERNDGNLTVTVNTLAEEEEYNTTVTIIFVPLETEE